MPYTYSAKFEAWWLGYPRKSNKDEAWFRWQKMGVERKPGMEVILTVALKAQVEAWKTAQRPKHYMPLPASWLHKGAWKDFVKEDGSLDIEAEPKTYWRAGELRESDPES